MSVLEAGGITLHVNVAPPVYAPGGLVAFAPKLPDGVTVDALTEAETVAGQACVLMVVQCLVEEAEAQALLLAQGYTFASSWYYGPLASGGNPPIVAPYHATDSVRIRAAVASDVPSFLEIGERKREQYERFSPIFWKKALTPRQEFAAYVTGQVESGYNIALIAEVNRQMRGYIIAQCSNPAEGYVDDYAVADPATDWPEVGSLLLEQAARVARSRGVSTFAIVTGHADTPKRAAVESNGFVKQKNWLVKPLTRTTHAS